MIFYLAIAFFLFIYALLTLDSFTGRIKYFKRFYKVLFCFFGIIFICIGGFRWLTGSDWNAYYRYFNDLNTWKEFNNGSFEITYTILNFLVKCISSKYTTFLLLQAFLCVSLKMSVMKKIALYQGLCLFLYYCYSVADIFAVRQTLAISILMYSVLFIREHEYKKFILSTLLATSIHNASIIWLIAYKIYWSRFSKKIFISSLHFALLLVLLVENYIQ